MADDYLWDRTGPPDAEIVRLERLLARYRRGGADTPPAPGLAAPSQAPGWTTMLAVAAIATLAVGVASIGRLAAPVSTSAPTWTVVTLDGSPSGASGSRGNAASMPVGRWVETDAMSSARLDLPDVGRLVLRAGSRVRVVRTAPGDHRLEMTRGTLDAFVWAPPGQLSVQTPAATAVDLGCAYTLTTSETGDGHLSVTSGWVGLRHGEREAFVPAGASVRIHAVAGPGTPTLDAASPRLQAAVTAFDLADGVPALQSEALGTIVGLATAADALTLWHLLQHAGTAQRERVFDALARLVPPPAHVTREGVVAGDASMREAWWASLGHGDVGWWRLWQREWGR